MRRSSLGSIKAIDGKYKVTVTVGYEYVNGKKKQKRRSFTVKSMKDARAVLRKYDKESSSTVTFEEFTEEFIDSLDIVGSTKKNYRHTLKHFVALNPMKLSSITGEKINAIFREMSYADTTLRRDTTIMRMFFRAAKKAKYIDAVPEFESYGSTQTNTMKVLPTLNDVAPIFDKAYSMYENRESYQYTYFALLLAISAGLRIGEIIVLKWSNIDMTNDTITVLSTAVSDDTTVSDGHRTKTPTSKRRIPVSHRILEEISKIPRVSDYIFASSHGGFVTPAAIQNCARKLFDSFGYPKLRIHDLRHLNATELIHNNVDIETVSHRLGHSNAAITLKVYTHYDQNSDVDAGNLVGDLVLKKCLNAADTPK